VIERIAHAGHDHAAWLPLWMALGMALFVACAAAAFFVRRRY
jgi:hypothetical protein